MIKKIKSIGNLGVFKSFNWNESVRRDGGPVQTFKDINIIYGRNYSGKTTLSRILRAMETGEISDKFERPSFTVEFPDEEISQDNLNAHSRTIRVFNEDFIRDNLRFIHDPDESIVPFAILGENNSKIEKEIELLEIELGSKEEGNETVLYAKRLDAREEYRKAKADYTTAAGGLEKQLSEKSTGRSIGIKYKAERFGDQNYNIQKLKTDIDKVLTKNYYPPTEDQLKQYEQLISEKTIQPAPGLHIPNLRLMNLIKEAEQVISRKISESDKIEDFVKDAMLNRWVNEGRVHHKGKRDDCAFCGSPITASRWERLEKHFDEESSALENEIDGLLKAAEAERQSALSALSVNKSHFYSVFHDRLDILLKALKQALEDYSKSLDALILQLGERKDDLFSPKVFPRPDDPSAALLGAWREYEEIRTESNNYTDSLSKEQSKAREALRLDDISKYLLTIDYGKQISDIDSKNVALKAVEENGKNISSRISQQEKLIAAKKRQLNDEEQGARKVNEYLNNFFGHQFLSLQSIDDGPKDNDLKRIRFEVVRDGNKAYHLSEGERSLLAFCYFMAKLDDSDTRGEKPIIWIDDPISSLDGNHVFFVYSLIDSEIITESRFEQLFVSTHNLDFLKYLKQLTGKDQAGRGYQKEYFVASRKDKESNFGLMPKYLKDYVTEFNYLFHQIYKCAFIGEVSDTNYTIFYGFCNNARKFLEIYLYYRYPDNRKTDEKLRLLFGGENIPAILTERMNNEYSHLSGIFERGSTPVEVPEMQTAAKQIIERLKQDREQYNSLLNSIGEPALEVGE